MSAIVLPFPVDDPSRSSPLPSIENSHLIGSSKSLPELPDESLYDAAGYLAFTTLEALSPSPPGISISIVSALQEPRILANFLRYVRWHDFYSLALTCTACSNVLEHPELRDVVLSAFVPGYRDCLCIADLYTSRVINFQLRDLSHFMISQQLPLHHYPTHALATLSGENAEPEDEMQRYIMLCQAHSRMVLLLQALVHSSPSPIEEEVEDPSLRYRNVAQQGAGRELVFPAPLSFFSNDKDRPQKRSIHTKFRSMPSASGRKSRSLEGDTPSRSLSRMSILGRNKVPPPPPSADSLGFKLYSGSWRRPTRKRRSTIAGPTFGDDDTVFRRPQRNFVSTVDSSGSSTDNGQGSPSPASTRPADFFPTCSLTTYSPHDVRAATSRSRAPILRVYFPCSEVVHDAVAACEAQLEDAGLWQHLSVGDVVCNLGYLPPIDGADSSNSDLSCDGKWDPEPWMIFDGNGLQPYSPSAVLPLSEPLFLPSPFYYAHITFPPINPRFVATLPREEPELSLLLLSGRVRSPHSPNGFARIKKYQWIARLRPHVRHGLGEGWYCDWILEGEGTKEGRQSLLDALRDNAGAKREWKLVMERCTTTQIWLRLR
ncbi:hypothetical protein F5148DRAFT_1280399 [Russula earlei]|uniref:Uncharacterized protein n=1 Tax=Russula earlei TaxID=71964 RepID=A0ACC0UK28_9AGAM|nr:hypothetical protein F5148DRAFT_1280399 [Russula earlei]